MASTFFTALLVLLIFLFAAQLLKKAFFPRLLLPPSVIAGFLALLLGPELLGPALLKRLPESVISGQSLIGEDLMSVWKEMPVYLISVVFAGLFLGKRIPSVKKIWKESLPNLAYGYTLAFGQYTVGLLTGALLLVPLFDGNVLSGALIAIGFQGGHGTVAGLDTTFQSLNFDKATDLGLGIATIGLLSAVLFGTLMSNLSKGTTSGQESTTEQQEGIDSGKLRLPVQASLLALSIALGWLILKSLQYAESQLVGNDGFRLFHYVPLFPVAMIGGLLVQLTLSKTRAKKFINNRGIDGLTSLALDLLVVSALGSLSLQTILDNWQMVAILSGMGLLYNICIYFGLAPYFFGREWKNKGLGELGQSMGTTAIGLLLLKNGDNNKEHINSFSYKQPLYEPIVGGGLVTAIALPLIAQLGPYVFAACSFGICLLVGIGFYWLRRKSA